LIQVWFALVVLAVVAAVAFGAAVTVSTAAMLLALALAPALLVPLLWPGGSTSHGIRGDSRHRSKALIAATRALARKFSNREMEKRSA